MNPTLLPIDRQNLENTLTESTPVSPRIKRVVFQKGMVLDLDGVRFKISTVNPKVMVLHPLDEGFEVRRK